MLNNKKDKKSKTNRLYKELLGPYTKTFIMLILFLLLSKFLYFNYINTDTTKNIGEEEGSLMLDDGTNANITLIKKGKGTPFNKNESYDAIIRPENSSIKEVILEDVNPSHLTGFVVDKAAKDFVKVYAVNPEGMNFTKAKFKVVARGNSLFKCIDWDFDKNLCTGRWKKIKSITPGEEYTFEVQDNDPGFGESNNVLNILTKDSLLYTTNVSILRNQSGMMDIKVEMLENASVSEITVYDKNSSQNITDFTLDDNVSAPEFTKQFALNPGSLQFNNVVVKAKANGNSLFKCVDWDSNTSRCNGRWKKIKSITPGKEYNFTINTTDPGFGEGNDTIIVLDKENYLLNSTQEVLSQQGNISDVKVKVNDDYLNVTINNIYIHGHNDSQVLDDLKIDVPANITSPTDTNEDSYSIDASQLSATNITLSGIAEAKELWKCTQWNFTTQQCAGSWTNIANLTIGDEYNITINTTDPGFMLGNPTAIVKKLARIKLGDKDGNKMNVSHIIRSRARKIIKKQNGDLTALPVGFYDLEVTPESQHIKKIKFNKMMMDADDITIKLEDITANITIPKGGKKKAGFSIDTSQLNFTSANLSVTAAGNTLYKCANWNFTQQKCYGSWVKVRSLIPGQNYTLTITPGDPGYIEDELLGDLASIRSWFMQNDSILLSGSAFVPNSTASLDIKTEQTNVSLQGFPLNISTDANGSFAYIWNTTLNTSSGVYLVSAIDLANNSYNFTLKLTLNDYTIIPLSKVKEDTSYAAVITNVKENSSMLTVTFHHDAPTPQQISVQGNINYTLTKNNSSQYEDVNLTISNWNNQFFRIIVGSHSDVLQLGSRKNITLQNVVGDNNGSGIVATAEVIDELLNQTEYSGNGSAATVPEGTYKILVTPQNHTIKSIILKDANIYANETALIKIDDNINETNTTSVKRYAIDPSSITFSNATATINASLGVNALYKCANWNFTAQKCMETCETEDNETDCHEEWVYVGDINATQEYNFTINTTDPAFAETEEAVDVALAAVNATTFVVTWVDEENKDILFKIMNINGSVTINDTTVDSDTKKKSRVSVTMVNSTHFVIGWADDKEKDISHAIYDLNGNNVMSADVDTDVRKKTDVSVAELGDRYAVCYANDDDNDADFKIYANNGTELVGETNVDGNMGPSEDLQNLISCAAINSTRFVYMWFDDPANAAKYRIVDNDGNMITSEQVIDSNVGEHAEVAAASLDNDKFAMAWFDSHDKDITIAIRDINNSQILAPTDIDTNPGSHSRVAIATVKESATAASDSFVVAWWDKTSFDIKAAVYSNNGSEITAPFIVDTEQEEEYRLIALAGRNTITSSATCPGTFIIAYTNDSEKGVYKGFYINGTEWTGGCALETTPPNVTLITPENDSAFNTGNRTFTYTVYDNSQIQSCSLYLNGQANQTNNNITVNTTNSFQAALADDSYNWSVRCTDTSSNMGSSENRTLIINSTYVNFKEDVTNARGQPVETEIHLTLESDSSIHYHKTKENHLGYVPPGLYTVIVKPRNSPVANITIPHINISDGGVDQIIDLDAPEEDSEVHNLFGSEFKELYVINPQMNFTANATVLAKGSKLYKCADWNYNNRFCQGNWTEYANITPGEYYSVTFNGTDPAFGEGSNKYTLKTINIDGDMSDWDSVLANSNNVITDGIQGIDDLDTGQTADRDLRLYAFTWDENNLYSLFERTASGRRQLTLLLYVDVDNDGLLESTDKVVKFIRRRRSKRYSSYIYDYIPSNISGDTIYGDGSDEPGSYNVSTGQLLEWGVLGGGYNGIRMETRLNWSALGIAPGSPVQMHISSARGTGSNLPSQVEDNVAALNTLISDVDITPNREGSGKNGDTIIYNHTITNIGNANDTIDITTTGTTLGFTVNLTYANGTALTDTNNDSKVDIGMLAPDASRNISVRITISGASEGDMDETYVVATSSTDSNITDNVKDTTTVGSITIYPARSGKITNGTAIEFNHTIVNNQPTSEVININASSNNSWTVTSYFANGTALSDTNNDSLVDVGNISGGASATIIVRISVPANASVGTVDLTTVKAIAASDSNKQASIVDSATVAKPIEIYPARSGVSPITGYVFYQHFISNNQNFTDIIDLRYNSSRNWSVQFYKDDKTTLLNDTDSDTYVDTGNLSRFGGLKLIQARIQVVPPQVPDDTFDQTNITASASTSSATDFITDNTTARILLTYNESSRQTFVDMFNKNYDTVYVRSYGLQTLKNYYYVWVDSNGTTVRTSPDIMSNSNGEVDDELTLNTTLPDGTYTILLHRSLNNHLITTEFFTVFSEPNITVITPNGGELWSKNKTIIYNISDFSEENVSITIQYSSNNGTTFNNITTLQLNATPYNISNETFYKIEGQFNYTWDTTTVSDGIQYLIKIVGDNTYFTGSDISNTTFTIDNTAPTINNINDTPDPVAYSQTINFTANVTDNIAVSSVWIGILGVNYTMNYSSGLYYFDAFNTSLNAGVYNYTVYANDTSGNDASASTANFTVSSLVSINVDTVMINFTSVAAGDIVNATTPQGYPVIVTNDGNVAVNISMRGTNLTGKSNATYTISVQQVKWDVNESFANATNLTLTTHIVQGNVAVNNNVSTYFRLFAPLNIPSQSYNGQVIFSAVQS